MKRWQQMIFCVSLISLLVGLTGCVQTTAPREFAPEGAIIARAIAAKLNAHYRDLSYTIVAPPPQLEVKNINVKTIDSFFLKKLPVYHLQGTYDLTLTLPHQTETRKRNAFDLHLQRQTEGKTWRSLERTTQGWRSYQLP